MAHGMVPVGVAAHGVAPITDPVGVTAGALDGVIVGVPVGAAAHGVAPITDPVGEQGHTMVLMPLPGVHRPPHLLQIATATINT